MFGPDDAAGVAVLSERVARQTGESMESLQGRRITVGEIAATVIGVMPDAFAFPSQGTDVWIPARAAPAIAFDGSRDARRFRLLGRLKPGVTFPRAGEDVLRARSALDPELKASAPARLRVESLYEALVKEARPVLVAFAAAAAVVLLIACANVATILIGRTIARRRELGVRSALGASRVWLFATIFSESILIALAGTILGTVFAVLAMRVFSAWAAGILLTVLQTYVLTGPCSASHSQSLRCPQSLPQPPRCVPSGSERSRSVATFVELLRECGFALCWRHCRSPSPSCCSARADC